MQKINYWSPDDKLGREQVGHDFTKMLRMLPEKNEAWVINLDAKYGSGKSFFVDKWLKDLKQNHQYCVVHFDAWSYDYSVDPFTSFAAEIIDQLYVTSQQFKYGEAFVGALEDLVNIFRIAWSAVDAVADGILPAKLEALDKVKDEVRKAVTSIKKTKVAKKKEDTVGSDPLKHHLEMREYLAKFQQTLFTVASEIKQLNNSPLVIVIDELDRCRPDFAIKLLERIKHVFNVKDVVFVIVTHRDALLHSINAIYGSEFSSGEYLERFFDLHFVLPPYELKAFVSTQVVNLSSTVHDNQKDPGATDIAAFIEDLAEIFKLNLREVQKALKVLMVLWPKENEPFALSHSRWFYKYAILFCCCAKFSTEKPQVNSFENFNSWSAFKTALEVPKRPGIQSDLWANIKPQRMYNLNHFGEILFTTFDKIEGRYDSIQASLRPNNNQIDLSFAQTMLRGMHDIRKEERNKLNITQKNLPSFLGRKIHNFAA